MAVTIHNSSPIVYWFVEPVQEPAGTPASIAVMIADSGRGDRHFITVDWGDGTSGTVAAADTGSQYCYDCMVRPSAPDAVFHTYATTGTYSITVTVRDDDGGMSSPMTAFPVVVFNPNERQTVSGYEAMDLGTIGGNAARPADINNRGQVVGTSTTPHGAEHAFLWDQNGIHDLGALGHEGSEAVRINDDGVIAGTAWTGTTGIPGHNDRSRNVGMIWQNGVAKVLDSTQAILVAGVNQPIGHAWLFQAQPRVVRAINGSGNVTWASYGRWSAIGWSWRDRSWQQLPFYPMAMNDRDQVVGAKKTHEEPYLFRAFVAEGGSARDLGVLAPSICGTQDCTEAAALDINESGQVVGSSTDASGRYHFVVWEHDTIKDLGFADWTYPERAPQIVINNRGDIAGSAAGKAFFWNADTMLSLPSLGGLVEVVGLNENGEVAGTIRIGAQQHAFVWTHDRGMVDLGIGPHGFDMAWIVDINDRGDILGYVGRCIKVDNFNYRCGDGAIPGALRWTQVRAILWRNTSH